jgi:TRAP-type C4-dicarboxylate transport system permease small subunit
MNKITDFIRLIAYVFLTGMVLLTFGDVTGRFFFHKPVLGTIELTEIGMAVLGGIAIFHTSTKHGHIAVDLLSSKFPRKMQMIVSSLGFLLGAATFGAVAYEVFKDGQSKVDVNRITDVFKIPVGPFEYVFAVGLGLFSLTLVIQAIQAFGPEAKKPEDEGQVSL